MLDPFEPADVLEYQNSDAKLFLPAFARFASRCALDGGIDTPLT